MKARAKRGFTLIEILIVVVILGILAAIVIPQFTDASQEASESAVKSQLQTMRSQVELFRVKNGGALPTDMDELVTADYLQKVPVFPTGYDYSYDNGTGEITASCPTGIDCTDW
ncbi:MAG: prepilin-type N-terminal cleavage/methylation domain-containing protein [Phycisphaerales bacterium]|nr:prepilin-type N-terminal cleavage/methylation domain-containing protein [Phycisphaerales bacterium]